jgi:hypothetical protein
MNKWKHNLIYVSEREVNAGSLHSLKQKFPRIGKPTDWYWKPIRDGPPDQNPSQPERNFFWDHVSSLLWVWASLK